ncbi:MAG: HipA domain-containing protein [Terracidiphilus sp.]
MKFDTKKLNALSVRLHGRQIGVITRLAGDRQLFAFEQDYIDNQHRPTLSLSFKGSTGGLVTNFRPVGRRVPVFFSNLLPEGHLRDYLAMRADVDPEREFYLLAVLGADLPGALVVAPLEGDEQLSEARKDHDDNHDDGQGGEKPLRFSLSGVQLKFSAIMEASGGLTIPAGGMGGSWIVKLPSARYKAVPENEFAMLELARRVGISVPENKLVDVASIKGLPEQAHTVESKALAVKRFDRLPDGKPVHMEDFAQVFGEFPNNKYKYHSYANIAAVLWAEIRKYCRRVVGGNRRRRRDRIRPPPRIFRRHRQRRHAPQELVPSLSR